MKAKRREAFCKYTLMLLLTLSLTAALIQSARERPYQLYGSLGLIWDAELIPLSGMLFPLTQIGSPISGPLAWIAIRIFGIPYQFGLLLPALLAFVGVILLEYRKEFGRALILIVLIPCVPIMLIVLVISLVLFQSSKDSHLALQQVIYYFGMLAVPVAELILLHGWMQNRSNRT